MRERLFGYWVLSWIGLICNIIALPIIALIISYGPPLKVANITLAHKSWMACCNSWNSFFRSSFSGEKMGRNFNPSIFINGNFWNGSLFNCKAYNSSRHLWNWWVYSFNNIIKYISPSLLV